MTSVAAVGSVGAVASSDSVGKTLGWSVVVNARIRRPIPVSSDAGAVAAMFGLSGCQEETLYDRFALEIKPGMIVVVTGPSGSGKSILLREVARQVRGARFLAAERLAACDSPAVDVLEGGLLADKLEMLSRCGLAEAAALVAPARFLSGGQQARLALAGVLHAARLSGRSELVIADEFCSVLDIHTARGLCRRVRKLVTGSRLAFLVATPRPELVPDLQPDLVILKPLGAPARLLEAPRRRARDEVRRWPISRGTIRDYHELAGFHYLAKPPACHKRVYVVRQPNTGRHRRWRDLAGADLAAVLVVSPPLLTVRGRNIATGGRYCGADRRQAIRRLNREVECISRVIVHPTYRGSGLAERLVRHALATAQTPFVEALATMGRVHPFLEKAGMTATHVEPARRRGRRTARRYVYYLAEVGK
jgi:ABC-type ATPase with predicted acetyltransferase domain